jgi:hypothetical protein
MATLGIEKRGAITRTMTKNSLGGTLITGISKETEVLVPKAVKVKVKGNISPENVIRVVTETTIIRKAEVEEGVDSITTIGVITAGTTTTTKLDTLTTRMKAVVATNKEAITQIIK